VTAQRSARTVVVVGANVGLGGAVLATFAARGWSTPALGRAPALASVSAHQTIACDATDPVQVEAAFDLLARDVPPVRAVIYNAHRVDLAPALELELATFEAAWRTCCYGAFVVARRAIPTMIGHGGGALLLTGATASMRGGPRSSAFAAAKFALRGLAQSLAREHSAAGIHVAHVVIDGLIRSERTQRRFDADPARCMDPHDVAQVYADLVEQPSSTWTHELDLRGPHDRFY